MAALDVGKRRRRIRDQRKAKVCGVERDCGIDIVDHVADVHRIRLCLLGAVAFRLTLSSGAAVVVYLRLLRSRFFLASLRARFAECHSTATPSEKNVERTCP